MKQGAIRILQEELTERGIYAGPVDGKLHDALASSVTGFVQDRKADLTKSPDDWSDARKRTAAFQLVCKDKDCDPGPVDGLWGDLTEFAYFEIGFLREHGQKPPSFRDIVPLDVNPNGWPTDRSKQGSQSELFDFFDFDPNRGGEPATVMVTCPWRLKLNWNRTQSTTRIGCHPKVAESLERVVTRIFEHYGLEAIEELGLNIYGGCKSVRTKRNGSTWSIHSFAAALDFDPDNNQLNWGFDRAHMARPAYHEYWRFWEEEGWVSLGRTSNFDWMHVQAVKLG